MKAYIDGRPDKDDPPTFEAPGNIVFLAVDKLNGAVLPSDSARVDQRSVHLRHAARREQLQPPALTTQPRNHEGTKSTKKKCSSSCDLFVSSCASWSRQVTASRRGLDRHARDPADAAFREPEVALLVDLHVAHGPAAAGNRPGLKFLRLRVEAHEHVLRLVAGLDVPDRAVGGHVDRVRLRLRPAGRLELLDLAGLRIEVAEKAARVVAVPHRVVLADGDAARPRLRIGQRILADDQRLRIGARDLVRVEHVEVRHALSSRAGRRTAASSRSAIRRA